MATSDSQNPELKGRYDIFLSFRGLDTRYKFTDHLYHALMREGFRTFRDDDEIERGVDITLELREAIRNSRMSVIVLSENYANSMACLCELQTIVKFCKKSDHFVLPVFYEVEPWVVREQSKNMVFEEKEVNVEKVKGWSAALNEVASMAGMVSRKESHGSMKNSRNSKYSTPNLNVANNSTAISIGIMQVAGIQVERYIWTWNIHSLLIF